MVIGSKEFEVKLENIKKRQKDIKKFLATYQKKNVNKTADNSANLLTNGYKNATINMGESDTSDRLDYGVQGMKWGEHHAKEELRSPRVSSGGEAEKDHILGNNHSPEAQASYDKARENEKKITPVVESIAKVAGSSLSGLQYSVKTASSVKNKLERRKAKAQEYGVPFSEKEEIEKMGDLVRYTGIGEHKDLATVAQETIDSFKKSGYKITEVDNKYLNKNSDYKGIHLSVVSPEGQKFEYQIHSNESLSVKNKLHPIYEEYRDVNTPMIRKKELENQMRAISSVLTEPDNIESLKNYKE